MGPGIVRILAEYPEIQLENDASAKEFKVIIKRIIQKREVATQKRETATQKGHLRISILLKREKLLPKMGNLRISILPKRKKSLPKRIWILPKRKYWSTLKTILRQPE